MLLCASLPAFAGGPRFITGYGLAAQPGQMEGWATSQLTYFTDPGSLASAVSHAQADTMVAAAAAVWNVPTSTIALALGGALAEHVSGANSYFNGSQFVFPSDVETSNEGNIPVAVIYDTDGSITDLLLGSGASEPSGCRQSAVTQSVDDLGSDGHIHHALVVLNGRCVGNAPEQLMQMQYQLARAFGRVLGLSWSQLNDNVFTGASPVNGNQFAYWPLMHPLDMLCSAYSYQCMLNPFTLRADDLSGLASLYPVLVGSVPQGKQASNADAAYMFVASTFPTGQGMDWVNFAATRQYNGGTEIYQVTSGVTGLIFQQSLSSPVTHVQATNQGNSATPFEGLAFLRSVPVEGVSNVSLTSEPINSLYSGEYAIGPYVRPPVDPSGSPQSFTLYLQRAFDRPLGLTTTAWDGAASCNAGNDGAEAAPAPLDASGWQQGQLCEPQFGSGGHNSWGHTSWWSATVRAGRSFTLEVTATDEHGNASITKAQTVVGIWNASDATGTLPTLASAAVPFNSMAFGVTQIRMPVAVNDMPMRFVVGDAYGAGRPDFTYTTRLLYADRVTPATVGADGGTFTISGTGFRQGNVVTVNGATATVRSWSATQIVAVAPPTAIARALLGVPVSITVSDSTTGGKTRMTRALTYTLAPNVLQIVSSPTALETGVTAAVPFAVRVLASDGITPVAGAPVSFAVTSGVASLALCGLAPSCVAITDDNGTVRTFLSAGALGSVTLLATDARAGTHVQITLQATAPLRAVSMASTDAYVAAGVSGTWTLQVGALQDGALTAGVPSTWTADSGLNLLASGSVTDAGGLSTATVTAQGVGAGSVLTASGCVWITYCTVWSVHGVDPSQWQVSAVAGVGQSVDQAVSLSILTLLVSDLAGHPLQSAAVTIHQRVLGWEGLCSTPGRCPAAPVLASAQSTAVSNADGKLTLQPLQIAGQPQTVEIAITTGTLGFLTLTLVKTPSVP